MRFFVDEDVDAEVARVLRRRGHDAWTTAEAGRSGARDPDQLVYAQERGAVFVSHDSELVQSQAEIPMQRIIRLRCQKPRAADVIDAAIDKVVGLLEHVEYVIVRVSETSAQELNISATFSKGLSKIEDLG